MKKNIIMAVANQIQNMMYNNITNENGLESFEGWCEDGEVFVNNDMSEEEVKECMTLVEHVAPLVDKLMFEYLNVDNPDDVLPNWNKINTIIENARKNTFTEKIGEIDMLSYVEKCEDGKEEIWEDVFDYVDTNSKPVSVHFICGTGVNNYSVPLEQLTSASINKLYECCGLKC